MAFEESIYNTHPEIPPVQGSRTEQAIQNQMVNLLHGSFKAVEGVRCGWCNRQQQGTTCV